MKESIASYGVAQHPEVFNPLIFFVLPYKANRRIQGKGIEEIFHVAQKVFKNSYISYITGRLFPINEQGLLAKTISKPVGD